MNRYAEGKKKGILKALSAVVQTEIKKAYRSPMFWITIIGMIVIPMMFGLMMLIKKHPELASSSLFLSKAKMIEGDSSWQTYFGLFAQMISGAVWWYSALQRAGYSAVSIRTAPSRTCWPFLFRDRRWSREN